MKWCFLLLGLTACTHGWNKTLPPSSDLGSPRGYRVVRTLMHMHSPYSWDACDKKGSVELSENVECMAHLRAAFCMNRIDYAFMSDHPNHMSQVDFEKLLMVDEGKGDTLQTPVNWMGCPTDHHTTVSAGYEDRLLAMGMEHHFGTTVEDRGIYLGETASTVTDLRSQTGALMAVPHIESRDLSLIESLGVDALEVYNFHSNLDPNIRTTYLQRPQVDYLFDLFNYWADPYYRQEADLALISFFEISPLIVSKWQQTWSDGYTMAAFAASDSHENVLSMNAPDGDRLDSHRRLARWVSNHWLVTTPTLDHVKEAVKAGRGWFAVEGWGTPTGFDFTASTSSPASVAGVGERLKMKNLSVVLRAELPTLHAASPGSGEVPRRKVSIKKIVGSDAVTVVEAWNEAAQVTVTEAGIYRAEVSIIPSHLKGFLYFDAAKATQEYTWIFSNPIRLAWENP